MTSRTDVRIADVSADAPSFTRSQSILGQVDSHSDPFVSGSSGNALIVGGNWNNTSNAGLSYLNNNDDGGNSNNGSRLDRTREIFFTVISTSPLGGTAQTIQFWLVPRAGRLGGSVRCGLMAEVSP